MIRRLTAAACTVAALTGPAAAHAAEPLPPVIPAQQQQAAPAAGSWAPQREEVRTFTVSKSQVSQQPPRSSAQRWSMGYFVGYLHRRYPLESVNWDSLTHMAVGAALPRSDGSLDTTFFQDATAGPAWAKRVVAAAHEHDRKAILMLGGAGYKSGFSGAISGANRARFITNLLRVVDEYGFDGVDVDLEPLVETDGPNLMAFSRELRAARPSLLMTIPISAVNDNRPVQTQLSYLRELPRHYDQLNVMSYGLTSTWRGWRSWHTTPLSGAKPTTPMSVASSVEAYLRAGIPAAKLGMGVGFYGACYRGVTGPNQTSPSMTIVADDNKMSIANVMRDYYQSSLVTWDNEAQAPYLSSPTPIGPLGCTFIPFENERSLALKMRYAQSKGLGGIIIWNVNEGYLSPATGQDALLGVIERSRFMRSSGPAAAHAAEPLPPVVPAQQQQAAPAAGSWDDVGRRSGLPFDSGVFAHDAFDSTPGGGKVDGYERVTGRPVDLYQIAPQREEGFGGLLSETDRIAKAMPDGVQVDWAFPLVSREEGAQLGTAICQATPNPYVRPGWEFNLSGSWDWTTDRIGDAAFVQGFRDSIDGIRSTCPGIRAEWNPNSGQGGVEKAMQAWPGDEYVDVIGGLGPVTSTSP